MRAGRVTAALAAAALATAGVLPVAVAARESVAEEERREWPASAVARVVSIEDNDNELCTAVLVANDTAVTARHCVIKNILASDKSVMERPLRDDNDFFNTVRLEFVDENGAVIYVPIWGMKLGENEVNYDDWAVLSLAVDNLENWPPSNIEPIPVGFEDGTPIEDGVNVFTYGFDATGYSQNQLMSKDLSCELKVSAETQLTNVQHSCDLRDGASGGPIFMSCTTSDCVVLVGIHVRGYSAPGSTSSAGFMVAADLFADEIAPTMPPMRAARVRVAQRSKHLIAKDEYATAVVKSSSENGEDFLWDIWTAPSGQGHIYLRNVEKKTFLRSWSKRESSMVENYKLANDDGVFITAWKLYKADDNGNFCLRSVATGQFLLLKGAGKMTSRCKSSSFVQLFEGADDKTASIYNQDEVPDSGSDRNVTQVIITNESQEDALLIAKKGRRYQVRMDDYQINVPVTGSSLFNLNVIDGIHVSLQSVEHEMYLGASPSLDVTEAFDPSTSKWILSPLLFRDEEDRFCLQSANTGRFLTIEGSPRLSNDCDEISALRIQTQKVTFSPLALDSNSLAIGAGGVDVTPAPTAGPPTPSPTFGCSKVPGSNFVCLHQDYCTCDVATCDPRTTRNVACFAFEENLLSDLAWFEALETLNLENLDLDDETAAPLANLGATSLRMLQLADNKLTVVPDGLIEALPDLRELFLDGNQLSSLPSDLGSLSSLRVLEAGGNRLTDLPSSISSLDRLTSLGLLSNELEDLPSKLDRLTALQHLELQNNMITSVSDIDWGKFSKLTHLNVASNDLSGLPNSFAQLTSLSWLSMSSNNLDGLPSDFGDLDALTWLSIASNHLTGLPNSFGKLSVLEDLEMAHNRGNLKSLPDSFGNLVALTRLDLKDAGRKLEKLPDLSKLTKLRYLNLEEALSKSFSFTGGSNFDIGDLSALKYLNLRKNGISKLPDAITTLTNLQSLNVRNNKLTELPANIGSLSNLLELTLISNELATLPETFTNLTALRYMTLSKNPLTSLPESFGELTALTSLLFWDNFGMLTTLPNSFTDLDGLTNLVISNNPDLDVYRHLPALKNLKRLNLAHNGLTSIPAQVQNLTGLEELRVHGRHNKLTDLNVGPLSNLTSLDAYDLGTLSSLDGVEKLKKLRQLNVHNGSLTSLAGLEDLTDLVYLDASTNMISSVEPLSALSNMRYLDFFQNQVTSITALSSLENLEFLKMNANKDQDSSSSAVLAKLTALTDLQARNIGLKSLPGNLWQKLSNLRSLDLLGNEISTFPEHAGAMTSLTFMSLSKNPITSLPSSFGDMKSLAELRLWSCLSLTSLPDSFWSMRLDHLEMPTSPKVKVPSAISGLTRLTALNLGAMEIEDLPSLGALTRLQVLKLFKNPFESIDAITFRALTNLEELDLENNQLRSLPSTFTYLSNLDVLDFKPAKNFCGNFPTFDFTIEESDVEVEVEVEVEVDQSQKGLEATGGTMPRRKGRDDACVAAAWVLALMVCVGVHSSRAQLAGAAADATRTCELQGRLDGENETTCGSCFDGFASAGGEKGPGSGACRFAREQLPFYAQEQDAVLENDEYDHEYYTNSFLRFADFDGDGLIDVLLASDDKFPEKGIIYLHNIGTKDAPAFQTLSKKSDSKSGSLYPFAKVNFKGHKSYVNFDVGDLDGDGDLDLILSSDEGRNGNKDDRRPDVFLNDGDGGFDKITSDSEQDPFRDIQEMKGNSYVWADAVNLVDIDNDGDLDLFCILGSVTGNDFVPPNEIAVFSNIGTSEKPHFERNSMIFTNVGVMADLSAVDLDGDGLTDLVATSVSFETYFFRNTGSSTSPAFTLANDAENPLNNVITVVPECTGNEWFYHVCARTLAFADLFNAGSPDAFFGTNFHNFTRASTSQRPSAFVAIGDDNGWSANPLASIVQSIDAISGALGLSFADVDADGDLDAFVGSTKDGKIHYFRNDGPTSAYSHFGPNNAENPFSTFDDIHGSPRVNFLPQTSSFDTTLRAIVVSRHGKQTNPQVVASWWEQDETGQMVRFGDVELVKADIGGAVSFSFADIDGEGVLAYAANWEKGNIVAYAVDYKSRKLVVQENLPSLLSSEKILASCKSQWCQISFFDIDSDGDLDLLVGSDRDFLRVFLNNGTPTAPSFVFNATSDLPQVFKDFKVSSSDSLPVVADTDGDGDLDLWVATSIGIYLFENTAADCASQCTRGRGECAKEGLSSTFNDERDSFGLPSTSFAAGVCDCLPNFAGVACEQCDDTHYGPSCSNECPANSARSSPPGTFVHPSYPSLEDCACQGNFVRNPDIDGFECSCAPGLALEGSTCQLCRVGTFKPDFGIQACKACSNNMVTTDAGSTECTCAPGKEFTAEGCQPCALGFFKADYGLEACEPCANGTTTIADGSAKCVDGVACPPGQENSDGSECTPCRPGFYNDGDSLVCLQCPISRPETAAEGSTSVDACLAQEGTFFNPETNAALACDDDEFPEGALQCNASGLVIETVPLNAGFWRFSNRSLDIHECKRASYCDPAASVKTRRLEDEANSSSGSDVYCSPFHTGIMCSSCYEGFGIRSRGACEECTDEAKRMDQGLFNLWIAIMVALALVPVSAVVFLGGLRRSGARQARRQSPTRFTCASALYAASVSRMQSVAVKARLAIVFLQIYREFLVTTDFLTSSGIDGAALGFVTSADLGALVALFNIGCASVDVDFYTSLLAVTIWPLGVLALLGFTAWCFRWRGNYDAALGWAVWLGLELLFIVYSSVSAQIVRAFLTQPFERFVGDTEPYESLTADYTIDFASSESATFRIYSGIMIAVYPIGTALLFFGLWFKRASLGPVWKRASNFLWVPYKARVGFYESAELVRRFLLTSGFVLLTQIHASIAVICFVAFVSLFLSVVQVVKPYDDSKTGGIISNQHFAQLMLILLLLLGFCGLTRALVTEKSEALQIVVIALGCLGIAVSVLAILAELRAPGAVSKTDTSGTLPAQEPTQPNEQSSQDTKLPCKGVSMHLEREGPADSVLRAPEASVVLIANAEVIDANQPERLLLAPQNTPEEETSSIARAASLQDSKSAAVQNV
ncbi:Leucine-rich repeat-containing protein 1 [Hondaea fermentalgiana]|uniref:Leucine-rich repeat-containing protein 1 n=1 Tax=Hondaea fermentalgiana TaxID=2315210 RepID=A0A2R5GB05_9STRA|nr:Leucine-rich repeat-containing protein 1 [Hondaea fermentalgiana]|eukprot:GBG25281.1 Leucine-rich repeat-containing protein 1 [Hondaea fermentalgiana]